MPAAIAERHSRHRIGSPSLSQIVILANTYKLPTITVIDCYAFATLLFGWENEGSDRREIVSGPFNSDKGKMAIPKLSPSESKEVFP